MTISRALVRSLGGAAVMAMVSAGALKGAAPELSVPGRESANASIAASGQFVAIAWGAATREGATDVYAAASRDGGRTFSAPARASDASSQASLSGEQPPRVTLVPRAGREPSIVVVWTSKGAAGTRLFTARSENVGRSFERPKPMSAGDAAGNRGWEAITTGSDGRVLAIWLDHRELVQTPATSAAMNHEGHDPAMQAAPQADGVARAQLSKLWFGSVDGEAQPIAAGVCYCCKTTIASGPNGSVYAVWRHVFPGNIRDIAFTMSRDGGKTFAPPLRVSEDRWVLDGCPENGPALAVDDRRTIHIIWPTMIPPAGATTEATPALFYASSTDGLRFTPRQRLSTDGFPRHPQIAIGPGGQLFLAWDEQSSRGRRVVVSRGVPDGSAMRFTSEVVSDTTSATYPVLAAAAGGVVLAWTSGTNGQAVVRTDRKPY